MTAPLRMHWVQTRRVLLVLPTVTCTVCRLGLNWRREMPVTLVPTPPKYLALPRMVTELPITGFLPQISQRLSHGTSPRQTDRWPALAKLPVYRPAAGPQAEVGRCQRLENQAGGGNR